MCLCDVTRSPIASPTASATAMASYFIAWKLRSECQARIVRVPFSAVTGKELRNLLGNELGMAAAPTARSKPSAPDVLLLHRHPEGSCVKDDELVRSSSAIVVRRLPVRACPSPPPLIG